MKSLEDEIVREEKLKIDFYKMIWNPGGINSGNTGVFWNMLEKRIHRDNAAEDYINSFMEYLDEKSPEYKNREQLKQWLFRISDNINKKIAYKIKEHKVKGPILDIGCGITTLYDHLSKRKDDYQGIDTADCLFEYASDDIKRDRLKKIDFKDTEKIKKAYNHRFSSIVDCLVSCNYVNNDHAGFSIEQHIEQMYPLILPGGRYYYVSKSIDKVDPESVDGSSWKKTISEVEKYKLIIFSKRRKNN